MLEEKPLSLKGMRVAVTRPAERSAEAVKIIEDAGGVAVVAPTLELKPAATESLLEVCQRASEWDWIIFTSPAAIESLLEACSDFPQRLNEKCMVAVIGPRTGDVASEHGMRVDLLPEDYTAEGLLDALSEHELKGKRVAVPRTLSARKVLPEGLEEMGADVFVAEAYRSTLPSDRGPADELIDGIIRGEVDAVTFTSPLTVENLFRIAGDRRDKLLESMKGIHIAAIGPITLSKLSEYGLDALTPGRYTVKDMITELARAVNQ